MTEQVADPVAGPVALVTGAARGIGEATARRLVADGFAVVAVDTGGSEPALGYELGGTERLDAVVASLGGAAVGVVADVRDQDAIDAAARLAVERFGGLDVAVAAAGVITGGEVGWKIPEDRWEVTIGVNLTGVWRTAKATIPHMLARPQPRRGRFVAIASAAGMGGHPTISAYCASKHGVIGFVRSLATELGASGITANSVCPGSTRTELLAASGRVYGVESLDDFAVHHPLGRILEPPEIASTVSWICREESGGVTGVVLPVDGGMTI